MKNGLHSVLRLFSNPFLSIFPTLGSLGTKTKQKILKSKCNLKRGASVIECIKYTKTKRRKIIRWSFYQKLSLSSLLSFIHYAPYQPRFVCQFILSYEVLDHFSGLRPKFEARGVSRVMQNRPETGKLRMTPSNSLNDEDILES
jgi:hypothetical protein